MFEEIKKLELKNHLKSKAIKSLWLEKEVTNKYLHSIERKKSLQKQGNT